MKSILSEVSSFQLEAVLYTLHSVTGVFRGFYHQFRPCVHSSSQYLHMTVFLVMNLLSKNNYFLRKYESTFEYISKQLFILLR